MVDRLLDRWQNSEERPILILDFRGGKSRTGRASQFERALALARYLAGPDLSRIRTVAYLSGTIEGHAVLPVLACEEIVAHPEAVLGNAGIDESFIDATIRGGYLEIAQRRRTIPEAVVMGMLDERAAVQRVQTLDGARYCLQDELEEIKQNTTVRSIDNMIPEGDLGSLTGNELRLEYGFASHLARDRKQLASALRLPVGTIEEDPLLGDHPRPLRIDITGPVKAESITWVERNLRGKIEKHGVNVVFLVIDSPGGSAHDSLRLAITLSALDPSQIQTLAFVPVEARGDAALIAMACDQLYLTEAAVIGGPGAARLGSRKLADLETPIQELAASKHRDWSLMMGMVDPHLRVRRYTHKTTGEIRYFCPEELQQQSVPQDWEPGTELPLQSGLNGQDAVELFVARSLVNGFDELRDRYGLDQEIEEVRPTWAHRFIEFLASPKIAASLLFIGWFALMIEFMSPGLSLSGFTSGVCFLLYFWSNALHGTAGWLEVLLFVAGVVCIAMEIFVIPGLGAFGIGGAVLLVVSIVLASQTFVIPRNSYEWGQLPSSLFMVVAAGTGALASLAVMRRFLTHAPLFRRVSLEAPDTKRAEEIDYREALVHLEHLVGKRGLTTTQLTPSGKARFGDDLIDVISDGEVIPKGTDVYVTNVRGSEVRVRVVAS
jgi:membrane-bound ClpP family serine protease